MDFSVTEPKANLPLELFIWLGNVDLGSVFVGSRLSKFGIFVLLIAYFFSTKLKLLSYGEGDFLTLKIGLRFDILTKLQHLPKLIITFSLFGLY